MTKIQYVIPWKDDLSEVQTHVWTLELSLRDWKCPFQNYTSNFQALQIWKVFMSLP